MSAFAWAAPSDLAAGIPLPLTPMYASIPASRLIALPERLSCRSKIGSAGAPEGGTLIITSIVLPAAMKTSL